MCRPINVIALLSHRSLKRWLLPLEICPKNSIGTKRQLLQEKQGRRPMLKRVGGV